MRLSDFKDEKGVEVAAKLLVPIMNIAQNAKNERAKGLSVFDFASTVLKNSPGDVMAMLAILDDQDPAEYHCNAATVLRDGLNMLSDPELLALFGLRSQTAASSGSASENIEAPEASELSSATAEQDSKTD